MKSLKIQYFCFILCFVDSLSLHHDDTRCRCVCPSPAAVFNGTLGNDRKLFIAHVPPNKCNCDGVILPVVGDEVKNRVQEYCPRCECKFESRNPSVIMFVVVFLLWVITLLVVYMGFLKFLHPLMNKKLTKFYREPGTAEARNLLEDMED